MLRNIFLAKSFNPSFFVNGKNTFSKIKIVDGDIIHIPNFKNRVEISGEVNRPFIYELRSGESIKNIIEYASGLKSSASSSLLLEKIIPLEERSSDDNARASLALNLKESESFLLNNGDSINILPIPSVDLNISLFGRVKSPGSYPAYTSLKDILDIAGGFKDPIFRQTIREDEIIVLRQDVNQFYSKEIIVSYKNSSKFKLEPNDKVFVYENINYKNSFTYRVEGQVKRPGTYTLKKGITVNEALELAGGVTELSSLSNIIVFQEFTEVDSLGTELTLKEDVGSISLDFELGPNSVIRATPYENVVRVSGNVYNPGLVAFQKGLTTSGAIIKAGGYMPNSMRNRVYIKKANGEVKKANVFRGRAQRLDPGDTIVVPVDPEPSEFDVTTFISSLSTTLANIAAILVVVDNQN